MTVYILTNQITKKSYVGSTGSRPVQVVQDDRSEMKQYCRYCVNLCVNNVPYCMAQKICLSKSYCKRANTCKDFVFADVEPEYQDAFGETNGYHPRQPKKTVPQDWEQMELQL